MPDDQARIVRFWHAVEMFSPQQLPKTHAKDNEGYSGRPVEVQADCR
jgi:hypothetical protein